MVFAGIVAVQAQTRPAEKAKWKLIGPSTKEGDGFVFSTYYPADMEVLAFSGDGANTLKLGSKDGWPDLPAVSIFIFVFPPGATLEDARGTALDIVEAQDRAGFKQSGPVPGTPWAKARFLFHKTLKDDTVRNADLLIGESHGHLFFLETEVKIGVPGAGTIGKVAARIAAEWRWQAGGAGL